MGRKKLREPETAMIDAVTHDGRGITATDGKKVFVAGALAGEEVRFIRRKRRRNFDPFERTNRQGQEQNDQIETPQNSHRPRKPPDNRRAGRIVHRAE